MGKDNKLRNKKYAKLSSEEAEAKQRTANLRERQRQSKLSDAIKSLNNLITLNNDNGKKQPSQLSTVLDSIDYIKDMHKELQNARILVCQLQRQLVMSSRPSPLTGRQPAVLDTPQTSNDSSASQLQDQLQGNSQYLPASTPSGHFSAGANSRRLQPGVLDTPPTSNDSSACQLQDQRHGNSQYHQSDSAPSHFINGSNSCRYQTAPTLSDGNFVANMPHAGYNYQPNLPYFSMDRSNTTDYQHRIYGVDNQSGRPKEFSSCRFQPYSIGPAMTDYMYVGTQAPHTQTSATRFPAASTTNQFQPAPTDYTSCLYRQFSNV